MLRCEVVPGCGRIVVAAQDIPGGTIIFREEAYCIAPNEDNTAHHYCVHCAGKIKESFRACERCGQPYCSRECYDEHAARHRDTGECDAHRFCRTLKSTVPREDFETFVVVVLMLLRCVSEGKLQALSRVQAEPRTDMETVGLGHETTTPLIFLQDLTPSKCLVPSFDHVECLATNLRGANPEILDDFVQLHKLYHKGLHSKKTRDIIKNAQVPFPVEVSEVVFVSLACAFLCNGFGIWDSVNRKRGTAVYPQSSYFNHSCSPNAGRMNSPRSRRIEFFTARDVQQGEALCISYIDVKLPPEERIAKLQATYSFTCVCPRCDTGADDDTRNTLCAPLDPVLCENCISKVIMPIGGNRYLCPYCNSIQVKH